MSTKFFKNSSKIALANNEFQATQSKVNNWPSRWQHVANKKQIIYKTTEFFIIFQRMATSCQREKDLCRRLRNSSRILQEMAKAL